MFSSSGIAVVKLPKSGGVVELDEIYRERLSASQVTEYFYGSGKPKAQKPAETSGNTESGENKIAMGFEEPVNGVPTLGPSSTSIPLDLLEIYKVGQGELTFGVGGGELIEDSSLVPHSWLSSLRIFAEFLPLFSYATLQNPSLLLQLCQLEPREYSVKRS